MCKVSIWLQPHCLIVTHFDGGITTWDLEGDSGLLSRPGKSIFGPDIWWFRIKCIMVDLAALRRCFPSTDSWTFLDLYCSELCYIWNLDRVAMLIADPPCANYKIYSDANHKMPSCLLSLRCSSVGMSPTILSQCIVLHNFKWYLVNCSAENNAIQCLVVEVCHKW